MGGGCGLWVVGVACGWWVWLVGSGCGFTSISQVFIFFLRYNK